MLKNLLNSYKYIFPFEDFLYILQLEEYDSQRYLNRLPQFYFKRKLQKRDTLKFTSRIQTTCLLSVSITVLSLVFMVISPVSILGTVLLIPFFVLLSNVLLTPFYSFMKYRLQRKAAGIVAMRSDLLIVGVAGSYGKTTTKNFFYELIRFTKRTQMVPGNINTPTGIAAWVIKELKDNTELLIVEMDTYFQGEIRRSCMITPPDMAVITSIGDQHVERFGNRKKMAQAILEIFEYAKPHAKLFMFNEEYKKLKQLGIAFTKAVTKIDSSIYIKSNIRSESAQKDLLMAKKISEEFDIPKEIIKDTLQNLTLPDRRQKLSYMNGYRVIDDSYNISFTTALAAVSELKKLGDKEKKKTIVVTGGIPELGPDNLDANKKYADYLEKHVDEVVLLNTILSKDMIRSRFHRAQTLSEAWNIISDKYSPKKYILLIQPELNDLYY